MHSGLYEWEAFELSGEGVKLKFQRARKLKLSSKLYLVFSVLVLWMHSTGRCSSQWNTNCYEMCNEQLQKICTCFHTVHKLYSAHCVRVVQQTHTHTYALMDSNTLIHSHSHSHSHTLPDSARIRINARALICSHFDVFEQFNKIEKENCIFPLNSFNAISAPFRNECLLLWIL